MARVTIWMESPAATRALVDVVRKGNGIEVRAAVAGALPGLDGFDENETLLVSRKLPRRDILQLLGRIWSSPHPPHVLFLDPQGDAGPEEALELEPDSAADVLGWLDGTSAGLSVSERLRVRFRARRPAAAYRVLQEVVLRDAVA